MPIVRQTCGLLAVYFFVVHVGYVVAGWLALAVLVVAAREALAAGLATLGTSGSIHLLRSSLPRLVQRGYASVDTAEVLAFVGRFEVGEGAFHGSFVAAA